MPRKISCQIENRKNAGSFKNFSLFFLFIFILLVIPTVYAQPPFSVVSTGDKGIDIKYPLISTIKENETYDFHVHLFNKSDGQPIITGVNCYFHLYNSSGHHIWDAQDSVVSTTFDYAFEVNGNNFTAINEYSFLAQCNNTNIGGFVSVRFEVTPTGFDRPTAITIVFFSIIFLIIVMGMMGLLVKNVFDIIDIKLNGWKLIYNMSAYFGLLAVHILAKEYLGNVFINNFLTWLIGGGAVAFVLIPIAGFVMWFVKENWEDGYKKSQ